MNKFNDSLKLYKDIDTAVVKHKDLFITKNSNITARVNGVLQKFTINNLPLNYKAYIGVHGVPIPSTDKYDIYGKFYVKITDPFGREVTDFTKNHHLTKGLEVSTSLSNVSNGKVAVFNESSEKVGIYQVDNDMYNFTLKNNQPIEIRSVKDSVKANDPDNADPSTWIIIGGIIGGVIIICLMIYLISFFGKNRLVVETVVETSSPIGYKKTNINYKPMKYFNY